MILPDVGSEGGQSLRPRFRLLRMSSPFLPLPSVLGPRRKACFRRLSLYYRWAYSERTISPRNVTGLRRTVVPLQ